MSIFKNAIVNLYEGLVDLIPSFNPIIESIVKNLIRKQLGQYIDIPQFQLKSFKNVELENVRLKIEEINEKFLSISPFIITYGQIGKMKINVPLQDILSMPSSIEIDQVQINLRPNGNNISHESFEQRFQNLLKEKKPQHKEDEEQYDADKMNELKTFLLHVLFHVRATVKNIVIKIFLQPEMSKGVEEPYFMVRISQLNTIDQNSSKLQQNSQLDCSVFGSVTDTESFQKSQMSVIDQQSTIKGGNQQINEQIANISLQVKRVDVFLLKNSSLSPEEFSRTYPFSYPKSNHPTNLMHIPVINITTEYPVKTQNLNPKIVCSIDMDSFEIMIEPYQLKFIKTLIDIVESWKKQTSCLNLLLFTKDQSMRELIIQNNREQTQQLESRFSASQKPSDLKTKEKEAESDMDDMIFQSIAEFKAEFRKKPKKDSKINKQPEENFFNQSIMDGGAFANKNPQSAFDQSVVFDNQTMDNLICSNMKKLVEEEKKRGTSGAGDQGNKSKSAGSSLDLNFVVRKLGIYMLKDSVRGWRAAGNDGKGEKTSEAIIEYERVWSISQSSNARKNSNNSMNKPNENASKDQVRSQIPCSYFAAKISRFQCRLNTEQSKLYVEADLKSFKILDLSLNKGNSKNNEFLKQAKINELNKAQTSMSTTSRSTFWKQIKLPHILQPFQLQEGQHFCSNPIIIYKVNHKHSSKDNSTNPFFKSHSIPASLFKEKTTKKDQFSNKNVINDPKIQESNENAYEKEIKKIFPLEYGNFKAREGHQHFNKKDQQRQQLLQMTLSKQTVSKKEVDKSNEGFYNKPEKSNPDEEDSKVSPRFGEDNNSNEKLKGQESQLKEQITVVDLKIKAGGLTNICVDLRILLDLVAISSPSEKYSEYQAEKMHKELLEKAPKYVAPSKALKLIKSLERKDVKADIEVAKITWMVLSYKFEEFFIASKDVSSIYQKSPCYNCLCSNAANMNLIDGNKAQQTNSQNKLSKSIGKYSNQSLAGVLSGLALIQEKKGEVKVSFEELKGFILDISTHRIGKIFHIGKNLVPTRIDNSQITALSVIYPSIVSCPIKPSGLGDSNTNNYFDYTSPHQEPLRLNQRIVHISSEEQEQQNQSGSNQIPDQTRFKTANLPEDTFYKENEQEATLEKVKKVIKIGFPVLELYLFEKDLVSLGEVVFNIKSMIDIVDQYKFRIQDVQAFYDGTDSSAVVSNQMNILLDLQLYEVNCYYAAALSQTQEESANQPQQSQDPFRNVQGPFISESLVLHMKTVDTQIILNKEIKKEGKAKNFKLTLDVFVMVGEIMIADNSLPALLCKNSNDTQLERRMQTLQAFPNGGQQQVSQRMQTLDMNPRKSSEQFTKQLLEEQQNDLSNPGRKHSQQYNKTQPTASDPANRLNEYINLQPKEQHPTEQPARYFSFQNDQSNPTTFYPLFRIKSLFLRKQSSSKVLLYKMNLRSSLNSQIAYLTQFSNKKRTNNNNYPISSLEPNSRLILSVNILRYHQYPTIIQDKQLLLNVVIKKKEQLQTQFTSSKCKSQLNIKKMTLSQSVFGISPILLSKQLLGFITELQYFMALEKLSSDVFPKIEFKEIIFNPSDQGLLNDVMLDVFMSYDLQMLISAPMLIISDKTIHHLQSLPLKDVNQRFMGPFREVIAIDNMNVQFKNRTQLAHKPSSADKTVFELTKQKLSSEFKVEIEKITIDFLQQSNFDCGIDPFQLDFFFTETSSTILPYLGLSRLATLFNLNCWQSLDQQMNVNLHRLQIALYSDTFNVLPNLLSAAGVFLKSSSEKLEQEKKYLSDGQKYQQEAENRLIKAIGKAAQQNGDSLFAQEFQIEILSESEGEEEDEEEEKEQSIFQDKNSLQYNVKTNEKQPLFQNIMTTVKKSGNQLIQKLQENNTAVQDIDKRQKEILQEKGWVDEGEFDEDNFDIEEYGDEIGSNTHSSSTKQNKNTILDTENIQKKKLEQDRNDKRFDDSFEKIDGGEIIVDESLLKINDSLSFEIESIGIYLYDRLDFDFVSVSMQYSISEQHYLQPVPIAKQQQKEQKESPASQPQNSKDKEQNDQSVKQQKNSSSISSSSSSNSSQHQSQQNNNTPIKVLDIEVKGNHLESDRKQKQEQEKTIFQPMHVRERRISKKKKSSEDYLLFKIDSLKFSIDKYSPNENDIASKYSASIQTISMDNALLHYTILSTSPASAIEPQEFLKFSCFMQKTSNQKNENSKLENTNPSNKSQKDKQIAPMLMIVTIKSISLAIHQNIYLNFSQQGTEFLLKFLGKATQKTAETQQNTLSIALNRYLNKININFQPFKDKSKIQQQLSSLNRQTSSITVVELLCIPKISIFFSNKKEDFKFSELLKKQGFLQIINLGEFEAIELVLIPLIIEDRNIEIIGEEIAKQWKENIISNQKWSVLSKLPFIKNISNIGTGVYNLFYMPISYYQQGLSVVEGTYEGVKSFVKNTTTEGISLTNTVLNTLGSFVYKNAKTCSNALKSKKSSSP